MSRPDRRLFGTILLLFGMTFAATPRPGFAAAQSGAGTAEHKGPEQPVPFSHKLHLSTAGLSCKDCHTMPDPGEQMTLATANKCMTCHATIKKDSPAIQKLAQYKTNNEEIPWKRVYQVPEFVYFSHKSHVTEGKLDCQECHGDVKQMEVMYKAKPTSMSACMDCHRTKSVSIACDFCHEMQ